MTLMTKLYDNLLRINNQPLQLLYLMVMMIMVKMTTTMSENVTKYEKVIFSNYCYCCCVKIHVTWLQHTPKALQGPC